MCWNCFENNFHSNFQFSLIISLTTRFLKGRGGGCCVELQHLAHAWRTHIVDKVDHIKVATWNFGKLPKSNSQIFQFKRDWKAKYEYKGLIKSYSRLAWPNAGIFYLHLTLLHKVKYGKWRCDPGGCLHTRGVLKQYESPECQNVIGKWLLLSDLPYVITYYNT